MKENNKEKVIAEELNQMKQTLRQKRFKKTQEWLILIAGSITTK